MVLSRGAQPSIPAGRRPACPTFQQPMRPAISLFLSIASLARVRSKSPKDMSHAARLVLHPSATILDPSSTSCPWLKPSQSTQAVVPATTSHQPMPSQLLAPAS
ncbi:hypothetical protein ACFX1Q_004083 [Malus domestica]